ncbi:MAG TPA: beta-propeller fold lactonase family protein [Candidatus Acidoferrales bacterium]|nr:beta-propeller fold lactonase family protein [Candidatus Acidoferrales bacterium]
MPPPTPALTLTTISPNSATAGGAAFTLTIEGTNFVAGSMVSFGGSAPTTTFVNSTELTAAIPAASIASTGTMNVTVTNPMPGGSTSNPVKFTVTGAGPSPVPTITVLAPSCAPAGEQFIDGGDNQLTVISSNTDGIFAADAAVRWNGSDRPTTGDGSVNGLAAQISASDIATAGTASVTVFNPPPGGGTSNSLTFTITPGAVDPQSIAVDPAGKFVYVASSGCTGGSGGYVSMYTVNPTTGALTSIGPPVWTYGYGVYADPVTLDPLGKFAYVTNSGDYWDYGTDANGSVATYTIDSSTGALTSTGVLNGNCPGLCLPSSLVVDPSGKFAYALNGSASPSSVAIYSINATTGALTSAGTITGEGSGVSVAVHPSGKFAYVANASPSAGSPGSVSMYSIDATTGALTSIGNIAAGTIPAQSIPASIAMDPTGGFAYVANFGSNDISMYTVNTTTGILSSIGSIATGTQPVSVAVDPTGKFAYAVNFDSNDVAMYTINATTGALTSTGTIAAGTAPTAIAIHPSGKFAYVTDSGTNEVSIFSIDASTGTLTLIGTIGT